MAGEIAKWFVPSVSILFVVVGYVYSTAQLQLIGLAPTTLEATTYIASAGDFFVGVANAVAQTVYQLGSLRPISLAGHLGMLAAQSGLAVAAALAFHFVRRPTLRVAIVVVALVAVVAIKFLALDLPVSGLRDVILTRAAQPAIKSAIADPKTQPASLIVWLPDRQRELWADIVCSRVTSTTAQGNPGSDAAQLCKPGLDYVARKDGELLSQLLSAAIIAVLASLLLVRPEPMHLAKGIAILCLLFELTVPFSFGKLEKPTYFDFGIIRRSSPLLSAEGGSISDIHYGLIVNRTQAGISYLEITSVPCSGQADAQASFITLTTSSPNEILSVDEIYRQDVVAWSAIARHGCPDLSSPFDSAASWTAPHSKGRKQ